MHSLTLRGGVRLARGSLFGCAAIVPSGRGCSPEAPILARSGFTNAKSYRVFLASFRHSPSKMDEANQDSTGRSRTPPTARQLSGFVFAFSWPPTPSRCVGESGWREGRSLAARPSCQAGGGAARKPPSSRGLDLQTPRAIGCFWLCFVIRPRKWMKPTRIQRGVRQRRLRLDSSVGLFLRFPGRPLPHAAWGSPVGARVALWLRGHRAKREGVQPGSPHPREVAIYKRQELSGVFGFVSSFALENG